MTNIELTPAYTDLLSKHLDIIYNALSADDQVDKAESLQVFFKLIRCLKGLTE